MNQTINSFSPLTEAERLAYLDAMDITVWVPRDQPEPLNEEAPVAEFVESQVVTESNEEPVTTTSVYPNSNFEPAPELKPKGEAASVEQLAEELAIEKQVNENQLEQAQSVENKTVESKHTERSKRFLKMINWRSAPQSKANKKLLVICRHHKDQPAHSFARPHSPSQFMLDYINTINGLLESVNSNSSSNSSKNFNHSDVDKSELQIQMAHLTEAGLGNDDLPMSQVVDEIKPDLILLLGDESISHLFNTNSQVAEFRGKLHDLSDNLTTAQCKAVISYHPYSLIMNPALKKLALEDLSLLVNILNKLESED